MAEYIDREALLESLPFAWDSAVNAIKSAPAADVVPAVHGQWVKHTRMHGFVYCAVCKDVYLDEEWLRDGKWGYCPNCGARMDGEAE